MSARTPTQESEQATMNPRSALEQTVLDQMKSLQDKLKKAADEGPGADDVVLTPQEAMLAYRLLFGDARRG